MEQVNTAFDFPAYIADEDKTLHFLYGTTFGRMLLQPMCTQAFSKMVGSFMDSGASVCLIPHFIKKYAIPMDDYIPCQYLSFNDFFARKIKAESRPIDNVKTHLIAPCDSKVTVYPITEDAIFFIKDVPYSIKSLLRSHSLANRYIGGYCYIFRLSVDDYHRYCYPDNGCRTRYVRIPGRLHTVNPMVLEHADIYRENTREYAVLRTENFGDLLMMQVGAMLVGKISNEDTRRFSRGEEAGHFEYGGSTVVLLTPPGAAFPHPLLLERSKDSIESLVRMGECVGTAP